jgi:diacylglycerol diphosphate phosphatase/phosphatidate phosphatase
MGLFSRRAAPVTTNTTTAAGTLPAAPGGPLHDGTHSIANPSGTHHVEKSAKLQRRSGTRHHGTSSDSLSSRPTLGEWIRGTWLDILTMVVLGALGLGVSNMPYHDEAQLITH